MRDYLKTDYVGSVNDYPYGYTQRTTATFGLEFKPTNGFRTVFQTVNPKTGKLNKPKKSTYSDLKLMYKNDDGHYKYHSFSMNNGAKGFNSIADVIDKNKDLFTKEQLDYLSGAMLGYIKVSMYAMVTYAGAKFEDLKPLYEEFIDAIVKKDFASVRLDVDAIEATKDEDYKPFG